MKLYITPGSPYARMARVVVIEKGLENRVEIVVAQTRLADSPYYRINPSGRVPCLVRDDGVGLEESTLICAWLDRLDGKPAFALPEGEEGWEARRLEALARSLLDGLAVWGRELARPMKETIARFIEDGRGDFEALALALFAYQRQRNPGLDRTVALTGGNEVQCCQRIGARPSSLARPGCRGACFWTPDARRCHALSLASGLPCSSPNPSALRLIPNA